MAYEFLEIEIGPVDLVELASTGQSRIFRSAIGKILPYGDFRAELVGARSIKAYRLPDEPNIILISYSKYLQGTQSKDKNRGKIRSLVVVVDESELVTAITKNVNWVQQLFEKIIRQIPSSSTSWIQEDILEFDVTSISNVQLPAETNTYLKRGGVGLAFPYYSPNEWIYMEEVVRSLVLLELKRTKRLPSFCTLTTSTSEIAQIFALPRFSSLSSGFDEIEVVESEKAYNKGVTIGKRLFYALTFMILVIVILLGVLAIIDKDSISELDQTATAFVIDATNSIDETLTATVLPTCIPPATPTVLFPNATITVPIQSTVLTETAIAQTIISSATPECRMFPTATNTPTPTIGLSVTPTQTSNP